MVIGYVSYVHTYYIKLMHFNYKYIHTYIPAQLQTESSSNHTIMCQMLKHLKWPLHSQASCYQQKLLAHAHPMISTPISAYSRPQKITQIHIPNKFSVSIFFLHYTWPLYITVLMILWQLHQDSKSMTHIYHMQQYCWVREARVLLTPQQFCRLVVL